MSAFLTCGMLERSPARANCGKRPDFPTAKNANLRRRELGADRANSPSNLAQGFCEPRAAPGAKNGGADKTLFSNASPTNQQRIFDRDLVGS